MGVIIFALKLLVGAMIVTPFVAAIGGIWVDHYFKKKLESSIAWMETTREMMRKQQKKSS